MPSRPPDSPELELGTDTFPLIALQQFKSSPSLPFGPNSIKQIGNSTDENNAENTTTHRINTAVFLKIMLRHNMGKETVSE